MNKNFLGTLAVLNAIYIITTLLLPISLKMSKTGQISPKMFMYATIVYGAGFVVVRILNVIYFFRDKYRFTAYANLGILICMLIAIATPFIAMYYDLSLSQYWRIENINDWFSL